jgi:hypothetical protein
VPHHEWFDCSTENSQGMKSLILKSAALAALVLVAMLAMQAATAANAPLLQPDKLVILSTTDVKGKTSPCG